MGKITAYSQVKLEDEGPPVLQPCTEGPVVQEGKRAVPSFKTNKKQEDVIM